MSFAWSKPIESKATKTDDEAALVAAAQSGDMSAFTELFNRYRRNVFRLALKITNNREDAEDVTQEAFLKSFEHLSQFRGVSRFYTWLVRIAINEGLMKLRKRQSEKLAPIDEAVGEEGKLVPIKFGNWNSNPEQLLAQAELRLILATATGSLPLNLRGVFVLQHPEDFSLKEMAELLQLTTSAVKTRLFRARQMLPRELTKHFRRNELD